MAAIAVLGLASLIGFDTLFLKFHQIGFSNDFWQLDPRIHNLIAMFPQGFFLDATLFIAFLTMVKALLLMAIGGGYLLWRRRALSRERNGAEVTKWGAQRGRSPLAGSLRVSLRYQR